MRRLRCIGYSLLLIPTWVGAAAVTGEVYDFRTGAVVPGATVKLGPETATVTETGLYKLLTAPRKRSPLVARAPGYGVTVMEFLPVSPAPEEIWQNVPLMPLTPTAAGEDFFDFFFRTAPLEVISGDLIYARRFEDLPVAVRVVGTDDDVVRTAQRLEALHERWGTGIFAVATEGEVVVDYGRGRGSGEDVAEFGPVPPGGCYVQLPGGANPENLDAVTALLRRLVLAASLDVGIVPPEELRPEGDLADDRDAVIEIIYRETADFNYAVFRRAAPARVSILTDFFLGIGGYDRHGVKDGAGELVEFPADFQMGLVNLAGGVTYRRAWVKAGFWFSGIWEAAAEELYEPQGMVVEKVLRRNYSTYYRGGYWYVPAGGLRLGPFAGYRGLSIRGVYRERSVPGNPATPRDIDYTTRYDGAEAGVGCDVALRWSQLGMFGEYSRVFAGDPYNVVETGLGAVNRLGVGTFAFVRFYWGRPFRYTFGGLAMRIDIPL
ncbi:MAG: hypothetical protein JSU81_00990 [Candidatus Coatesbacteria bacterium]|nr:MAG: hypothetical protein JSU81_00990 [Candidatus Coatesbacteria bacterium]